MNSTRKNIIFSENTADVVFLPSSDALQKVSKETPRIIPRSKRRKTEATIGSDVSLNKIGNYNSDKLIGFDSCENGMTTIPSNINQKKKLNSINSSFSSSNRYNGLKTNDISSGEFSHYDKNKEFDDIQDVFNSKTNENYDKKNYIGNLMDISKKPYISQFDLDNSNDQSI